MSSKLLTGKSVFEPIAATSPVSSPYFVTPSMIEILSQAGSDAVFKNLMPYSASVRLG